jgi:hypothetical protein
VSRRTTLTLDDDVAEGLADEARRTGRPYRRVVNDALRRGLRVEAAIEPFRIVTTGMRLRPGLDVDDIEGLLDQVEGPLRR